jgi:hypothetical protein
MRTICSSVGVSMLKAIAPPIIYLCIQGLINPSKESPRAEAAIFYFVSFHHDRSRKSGISKIFS